MKKSTKIIVFKIRFFMATPQEVASRGIFPKIIVEVPGANEISRKIEQ
jgi:hypothetical protein